MSGSEPSDPPRVPELQPDPFHAQCQIALSVPRATTSIRPGSQDTDPGPPASTPPRDCQPLQLPPLYHLCQSALSAPLMKTSSWPGPCEEISGSPTVPPPRLSKLQPHACHTEAQ